jgi:hypothetical protein
MFSAQPVCGWQLAVGSVQTDELVCLVLVQGWCWCWPVPELPERCMLLLLLLLLQPLSQ